jgi:hypothetical protein
LPLPFLFQALNIANSCDLSYKASQDKRLQVELALINIAKITLQPVQATVGQTVNQQKKPRKKRISRMLLQSQRKTKTPASKKMSSISIKGALKGENIQKKLKKSKKMS